MFIYVSEKLVKVMSSKFRLRQPYPVLPPPQQFPRASRRGIATHAAEDPAPAACFAAWPQARLPGHR